MHINGNVTVWSGVNISCFLSGIIHGRCLSHFNINNFNSMADLYRWLTNYSTRDFTWLYFFILAILCYSSPWNITNCGFERGFAPQDMLFLKLVNFKIFLCSTHFQVLFNLSNDLFPCPNQEPAPNFIKVWVFTSLPRASWDCTVNPRKDPEARWPGTSRRASCATTRRRMGRCHPGEAWNGFPIWWWVKYVVDGEI